MYALYEHVFVSFNIYTVYKMNNRGPRIDTCGIPEITDSNLEFTHSNATLCRLPVSSVNVITSINELSMFGVE